MSDVGVRRFSDSELVVMHGELNDLRVRFDSHVEDEAKKFNAMIDAVHLNTKAIDGLASETKDIVKFHRDLQGTVSIGVSVQKFLLWLVKWGAIGVSFAAVANWLLHLFDK